MPIDFTCDCGQAYRVKDDWAGKTITCKKCSVKQEVPTPVLVDEENAFADYALQNESFLPSASPHEAPSDLSADAPPTDPGLPRPLVTQLPLLARLIAPGRGGTFASNPALCKVDLLHYWLANPAATAIYVVPMIVGLLLFFTKAPWFIPLIFIGVGGILLIQDAVATMSRFCTGDLNPAIVISTRPTLVAVFVDLGTGRGPRPAVRILKTSLSLMSGGPYKVGSRMGCACHYYRLPGITDHWGDIYPTLAPLAVAHTPDCERLVRQIPQSQWRKLDQAIATLGNDRRAKIHKLWPGA